MRGKYLPRPRGHATKVLGGVGPFFQKESDRDPRAEPLAYSYSVISFIRSVSSIERRGLPLRFCSTVSLALMMVE